MLDENTKFDFKKLHKALSDTYKRQMEIKKEYPHRYEEPSWKLLVDKAEDYKTGSAEYRTERERRAPWLKARNEFAGLSYRMTVLCCIINHAKGKLHMSSYDGEEFTKEHQESWVSGYYEEFVLEDVDSLGISETDEAFVDKYVADHQPPKKGLVSRFVEALGL